MSDDSVKLLQAALIKAPKQIPTLKTLSCQAMYSLLL